MLDRFFNRNRVQVERSRAVFVLIALAGILPSALVLWFANSAVRNEQLAATQIEAEAQKVLLNQIKSDLAQSWNSLLEETDQRVASLPPATAFYETVTNGGADGLVIFSATDPHRVVYPGLPKYAEASSSPPTILSAGTARGESDRQRREFPGSNVDAQLASTFAMLTAAIRRHETDAAERAAQTMLNNTSFELCTDKSGRHVLSNIELFILENRTAVSKSTYSSVLSRLTARLNNYRFESIPASQRRFLMNRVAELSSPASAPAILFPTMPAEFLSAQFMETNHEFITGPNLSRSTIESAWQQRLPSGIGIALFSEDRIRKILSDKLSAMDNPLAKLVHLEALSDTRTRPSTGAEILLGNEFPGWRLRIVDSNVGTHGTSLKGIYVTLSVVSVGVILLILILIASITLRRLALAQQKNTMVATVSHELKTPVSSIKLLVDSLLQDKVWRPDRVREYLDLISRENLRLSQLIENFLSFSRIERTKFRIERQPLEISELIREVVITFSRQVEISDRELTVEIAPNIPTYRGDTWALNRVLLNLLDNAYKFSDPPRQIRVSARVARQSVIIAVSDHGIGIREADLEKIFSQFYQVDQKLSRSNEGCGLGLSIVEHIVKLHDGTIGVESTPGVGSTFTIHLPFG